MITTWRYIMNYFSSLFNRKSKCEESISEQELNSTVNINKDDQELLHEFAEKATTFSSICCEDSLRYQNSIMPEGDNVSNKKNGFGDSFDDEHFLVLRGSEHEGEIINLTVFSDKSLVPVKFLGSGGQGEVHLVQDECTQEKFALKIINQNSAARKYEREALEFVTRYNPPSGMLMLDSLYETDEFLLLLTCYAGGGNMREIIPYLDQFSMERRLEFVKPLLAELCISVDFLHSHNYVHRDIKASNCFMDTYGHLVLGDFGSTIKRNQIKPRVIFGTVPYTIAPEMFQKVEYGTEVDWWAVGVLACELILGFFPFEWFTREDIKSKDTVNQVIINIRNPRLPKNLDSDILELIKGFLHPDPRRRLGGISSGGLARIQRQKFFAGINWRKIKKGLNRQKPLPVLKLIRAIKRKNEKDLMKNKGDESNQN